MLLDNTLTPLLPICLIRALFFFFITIPVFVSTHFLLPHPNIFSTAPPPYLPFLYVVLFMLSFPLSGWPSLLPCPLHQCIYNSGGEPSAGCRRQHQDRRLRLQQRVHTGQQAGHVLWLAAICCPRAFPGQEVWRAWGGRLEFGSNPLHVGQRLIALWRAEPEGKLDGRRVCVGILRWWVQQGAW